ncbi:MAG: DUF6266 family protein, partial [Ginsengibacter sp.]
PSPVNAAATIDTAGNIQFSWNENSDTGTAKKNDKAVLVAYFPAIQQVLFSFDAGTRAAGGATLITGNIKGQPAETWMGFLSNDEKDAANSVYTGSIIS